MITIHDVTSENYKEILKLKVSKEQSHFIETPCECLTEAADCKLYKPVGLHVNGQLAGFSMYGYLPEEDEFRVWIDRFLIDEKYQGIGLGSRFMQAMIEKLRDKYGDQPIYLSVYDDNKVAIHLYKKLGFVFTGELDVNGELVMAKLQQGACLQPANGESA